MLVVRSYHEGQPEYAVLQNGVVGQFFVRHKAKPKPRPEEFWSLTGREYPPPGQACLGLSWGDHGQLFSEYYLPDQRICDDGERHALVEIGQVASFVRGAGSKLLELTMAGLAQRNLRYALMTVTAHMRSILENLSIPYKELGIAEQLRCRDAHLEWGSYYQNTPRVILIDLQLVARSQLAADHRRHDNNSKVTSNSGPSSIDMVGPQSLPGCWG